MPQYGTMGIPHAPYDFHDGSTRVNVERRTLLIEAAESEDAPASLRKLVQQLIDSGVSEEDLLEDLGEIRLLFPEKVSDVIADTMDLLSGWCAPEARIRRSK